jgi:hypothetical protein
LKFGTRNIKIIIGIGVGAGVGICLGIGIGIGIGNPLRRTQASRIRKERYRKRGKMLLFYANIS